MSTLWLKISKNCIVRSIEWPTQPQAVRWKAARR